MTNTPNKPSQILQAALNYAAKGFSDAIRPDDVNEIDFLEIQNKKSKQSMGRLIGRWARGDSSGSSLSPLTPTGRGRKSGAPL